MTATESKTDALAAILITRWKAAANKFIDLAAALPDGKLETQLVSGTRTCGALLRHVAYWNCYVADSLNGRTADDTGNEISPHDYPDKTALITELRKNSRTIASGLERTIDAKSLELICIGLEHLCEHYGQLALYARLLGIVPPASQS
jgi:uncharacterized damage-inducible protein DinB